MKKIIIILIIIISMPNIVSANVYIDAIGAYTMAGDLDNQIGGGGSIATDVHPNVNLFAKYLYNTVRINVNEPDEEEYTYTMAIFGFQHLLQIAESPAYWTNSLGIGAGRGSAETSVNYVSTSSRDSGICFVYWTGILVEATQYISPYIEIGYHKALFYSDFENTNVSGFQFLVGVRATLFGKNRSITTGY